MQIELARSAQPGKSASGAPCDLPGYNDTPKLPYGFASSHRNKDALFLTVHFA
ncbi:MAG: hypothetical protein ACFNTM_02370 [Cardiobacterium sp.]